MKVRLENPEGAPAPVSNYSQVARVDIGDTALLFLSGQVAIDMEGNIIGKGDAAAQCECILENMRSILRAYDGDLSNVMKVTILFTDIADRAKIIDVRGRYFSASAPASTAFEVSKLALPDLLLEIEAIAAVPSGNGS